jgi:hypothetical protein
MRDIIIVSLLVCVAGVILLPIAPALLEQKDMLVMYARLVFVFLLVALLPWLILCVLSSWLTASLLKLIKSSSYIIASLLGGMVLGGISGVIIQMLLIEQRNADSVYLALDKLVLNLIPQWQLIQIILIVLGLFQGLLLFSFQRRRSPLRLSD